MEELGIGAQLLEIELRKRFGDPTGEWAQIWQFIRKNLWDVMSDDQQDEVVGKLNNLLFPIKAAQRTAPLTPLQEKIQEYRGWGELVNLIFSPDGKYAAIALILNDQSLGRRGRIMIHETDGSLGRGIEFDYPGDGTKILLGFTPDSEKLVAGLDNGQAIVFNPATGGESRKIDFLHDMSAIAINNQSTVAAVYADGKIFVQSDDEAPHNLALLPDIVGAFEYGFPFQYAGHREPLGGQ